MPLAFSLRRDGFDVVQAADGVEAVEAFEAAGPSGGGSIDLVLLDLMLPRLSGIEVCRHIRLLFVEMCILLSGATIGTARSNAKCTSRRQFAMRR